MGNGVIRLSKRRKGSVHLKKTEKKLIFREKDVLLCTGEEILG